MGILSNIFGTSKREIGPDGKVICRICHSRILPGTYKKFGGKCAPCANGQVVSKERIGENEGNISQNRINQPLGFFYCPINDPAVCSDDGCPCGPVSIPYGGGYLYISQSAVDFRKDARSDAELKVKGAAYIKSLQQGGKTAVVLDPTIYKAILICEEAAKRRRLNLQVAAADAKYAWETAQAPLRPTPSYKSQ